VSKVRISIQELKQALAEIESRSNDLHISVEIDSRTAKLSASDRSDNMVEAVLYEDGSLGAQFRCTERLMYMKKK
jgi:hypothetical protein